MTIARLRGTGRGAANRRALRSTIWPSFGAWTVRATSQRGRPATTGRFETPGVWPWSAHKIVRVHHPDYRPAQQTVKRVGGPGERVELAFTLTPIGPSGVVAGRLTVNGVVCPGYLEWRGQTRSGRAHLDHSGEFRLEDAEAGRVELTVHPRGYSRRLDWGDDVQRILQVREGEEHACDFALTLRLATISGSVRREDGVPLPGVNVLARSSGGRHHARTDASGAYAIEVPSTGSYSVLMSQCGETQVRKDVEPGTSGLDFVVQHSGRLRFCVVDADTGDPVEQVEVRYRLAGGGENVRGMSFGSSRADAGGWKTQELPVGSYVLTANASRRGYRPACVADVIVRASDEPTEVTIELLRGATVAVELAPGTARLPRASIVLLVEEAAWEDVRHWKGEGGGNYWDGGPHFAEMSVLERAVHFQRGKGKLTGLAPGRYRFKVFGAKIAIEPEFVEVGEGADQVVQVRWQRMK